MKYYLIEIAEGDAKIKGKAVYEYDDRNSAIASFHSKLGVAMKSELYTSEQILVLNSANGVEMSEKFERPMPEEIEETTTEEAITEE